MGAASATEERGASTGTTAAAAEERGTTAGGTATAFAAHAEEQGAVTVS